MRRSRRAGKRARARFTRAASALLLAVGLIGAQSVPASAAGQNPVFAVTSTNPFGLADIGKFASPAFADIDGDGDLDAFVGEYYGDTLFFRNTGSAIAPAFAPGGTNPFGLADVGVYAAPTFADIDGDGDLDAFVGNYIGNTLFFRNTGSAITPTFGMTSTNPFGLADVGYSASPTFVDIDGDGDLDAFVGSDPGNTIFFRNTGNAKAPAFAPSSANPFGLVDVGSYAQPTFADIDGDGDLDAFVAERYGSTAFFRNIGSAIAPAFAASSANPFGLTDVGDAAAPTFADIDGDGDLDAFVGNFDGSTLFFRNIIRPIPSFPATSTNPFGLADVGTFATPGFADIDGDGDLDAFVGNGSGNTIFFRNTGSAIGPAFVLTSTNPFGLADVGGSAAPTFADIDADGDLDAFVGNDLGNTFFFRNTGGAITPTLVLTSTNPFGLADVGGSAAPTFADVDDDGDLDAFVGNSAGNTAFFRNIGSAVAPAFAPYSTNPFGLADVGDNAAPTFADVDGDGDLDAFVGNDSGNTFFFRNTGSALTPAFVSSSASFLGLADVAMRAAPKLADIDGDGDLDAFVGDSLGNTIFFRNVSPAAPDLRGTSTNPFGLADVGTSAMPAFADIDGDGDLDAFVGNSSGETIFFRNTGSAIAPSFGLKSTNPFGLAFLLDGYAAPTFCDIDGDGDLDVFLGDFNGNTTLFRNTGSAITPTFASFNGLVGVGTFAIPAFADMDGDGDLDAFVGNGSGNTIFFRNTGNAFAPAFASSSNANPFGLANVGNRAAPTFADIDGDGDLDAFVGNDLGNTVFFRNTGSAIAPAFSLTGTYPFGLADVGARAAPAFADIDADGDLDVFVGESDGNTLLFRDFQNHTFRVFVPGTRRKASSGW